MSPSLKHSIWLNSAPPQLKPQGPAPQFPWGRFQTDCWMNLTMWTLYFQVYRCLCLDPWSHWEPNTGASYFQTVACLYSYSPGWSPQNAWLEGQRRVYINYHLHFDKFLTTSFLMITHLLGGYISIWLTSSLICSNFKYVKKCYNRYPCS